MSLGGSGGSYAGASTAAAAFAFGRDMGCQAPATMVENTFRAWLGMPPLGE